MCILSNDTFLLHLQSRWTTATKTKMHEKKRLRVFHFLLLIFLHVIFFFFFLLGRLMWCATNNDQVAAGPKCVIAHFFERINEPNIEKYVNCFQLKFTWLIKKNILKEKTIFHTNFFFHQLLVLINSLEMKSKIMYKKINNDYFHRFTNTNESWNQYIEEVSAPTQSK